MKRLGAPVGARFSSKSVTLVRRKIDRAPRGWLMTLVVFACPALKIRRRPSSPARGRRRRPAAKKIKIQKNRKTWSEGGSRTIFPGVNCRREANGWPIVDVPGEGWNRSEAGYFLVTSRVSWVRVSCCCRLRHGVWSLSGPTNPGMLALSSSVRRT